MNNQRELKSKNLREARQQLEELDALLKAKTNELRDLRKQRKDLENRIESIKTSLGNLDDQGEDLANLQFDSDAYPWSNEVNSKLRNVFNIQNFRHLQRTVINCTLSDKDCIYVAATGSGKSLVFQLPALVSQGITIVVSPLLSLMEDQVTQLEELGIPAMVLNSATDKDDARMAMQSMIDQNAPLKLIYVTPEKLAKSKRIMAQIEKMYQAGRFSRLVIDEVHCCSQWGHDFRRDYQYLSVFKRQFPETPILGLTATATSEVILDIQKILNIEGCYVFKGSFYRPNLKYEIRPTTKKDNVEDLINLINTRFSGQTGIVYCLSIKDTEDVASKMSSMGTHCYPYHAQLSMAQRNKIQQQWYKNKCKVIAATVAFGLGINKIDVRFVIHYSISKSIENYYQETGRAGRDGKPAYCICYYRFADVFRATSLTFTEKHGQKHVYQMLAFCLNRKDCRKQLIADYFEDYLKKDQNDARCCDNCCDNLPISTLDVSDCLNDILKICQRALQLKEKLTPTKLLDAWTQKGGPKNFRVEGLRKPSLVRSECEAVVGLLLVDGYLREDFHITPYATISYLLQGPRAHPGCQSTIEYDLALESQLKAKQDIAKPDNSQTQIYNRSPITIVEPDVKPAPTYSRSPINIIEPDVKPTHTYSRSPIDLDSTPTKKHKSEDIECFIID